jgi:hypothetical protein
MKLKLIIASTLICLSSHALAANYLISNVVAGDTTDVLFEDASGSLLSGGIISIGFFPAGAPSSTLNDISTTISAFTPTFSTVLGGPSVDLGGSFAGYVQSNIFSGAQITAGNPLLGQGVYLFVGNASTLAASTAVALLRVGTVQDDVPFVQQYTGSATGTIVGNIGMADTFTGNSGVATGNFRTVQLSAIPEPSSILLGAVGALGLLRRRRN